MSNKYKYLVVEPGLSYVSFAQALTAAKYAQVYEDCHTPQYPIVVVPYSQQLHATLLAQKAAMPNPAKQAAAKLKQSSQALAAEIKKNLQYHSKLANQVQHVNNLCAANSNVLSIFSKPKKHKPKPTNSSNTVVKLFPTK